MTSTTGSPRVPGPTVLSFEDLDVTFRTGFGPVHAVKGISVDVRAGEVVALVGESGSGKSVTSMTALSLLPKNARTTGRVQVNGQDVSAMDERALRRLRGKDVAMVFQEPMTALNPVLTIGDQLTESLELHGLAYGRQADARATELLRMVGIPEPERRLKQYPHELSGGQRQRVVIALAISCDPKVIIADEPTTALDVTVQAEILDLLRSLKDKLDTGILLITHNMGVVADMADRVAVMLNGEIVEVGTADQVLNHPTHEYTRRLLASVPHLGAGPGQFAGLATDEGVEPAVDPTAQPGAVRGAGHATTTDATTPARGSTPASGHGSHAMGTFGHARAAMEAVTAARATDPSTPALDVRNLVVEYRRLGKPPFRAVDDVSFTIGAAQIVGLVGESGSGKSTIARCALALIPAESGEVSVFGDDLVRLRGRQLKAARRRIGVVFQDPAASLNPRMPIAECIAEPMVVHKIGDAAMRRDRVRELLEAVELPRGTGNRYPHELSGGQRQRVSIARALSLQPDLLVADEPTSALDVSVQASVLRMFSTLQERYGFACLFVSHDLAVIDMLAQHVVVLQDGRVVEQGDRVQVLQSPREEYTKRLLAAAPVPEPQEQRRRREARHALLESLGEEVSELHVEPLEPPAHDVRKDSFRRA